MPRSEAEEEFALHLKAHRHVVPAPVRQHPFGEALGRKWRMDFAWPDRPVSITLPYLHIPDVTHNRAPNYLAVEVQGEQHRIRGRHRADMERANVAQLLGWLLLQFRPAEVKSAKAIDTIVALFKGDTRLALQALQRKE